MAVGLDAIYYIEKPPLISFEDGMFHVCYDIGKSAHFEVVMSPNVYLKTLRRAHSVVGRFHEGKGNVLAFDDTKSDSGQHH